MQTNETEGYLYNIWLKSMKFYVVYLIHYTTILYELCAIESIFVYTYYMKFQHPPYIKHRHFDKYSKKNL